MKKVYVDTIKNKVNLSNLDDQLEFNITYQDGSTFVTTEDDMATLLIRTANNKTFNIIADTNYLGHLKFTINNLSDYFEPGTYLGEIIFHYTDYQGVYPHNNYLEITLS